MINTVHLRHGTQHSLGEAEAGVVFLSNPAYDGEPLHVELSIGTGDGQDHDYTLHPGELFTVGDATWRVADIDGVGTYDYVIRLERVDGATA